MSLDLVSIGLVLSVAVAAALDQPLVVAAYAMGAVAQMADDSRKRRRNTREDRP